MPDFVSEFRLDKAVDVSAEQFIDVPYIANWIFEHPGLDLNLKGIWIADPSLTWGVVQQEIPALRFARVSTRDATQHLLTFTHASPISQAHQNVFPFNSSFWAQLEQISDACGYTDYLDQFVTYPPKGQLPFPPATNGTSTVSAGCRIHNLIQRGVSL